MKTNLLLALVALACLAWLGVRDGNYHTASKIEVPAP